MNRIENSNSIKNSMSVFRPLSKLLILMLLFNAYSCKSTKSSISDNENHTNMSLAKQKTIIYKTSKDFNSLIPITMNESKTQIVSYPDPSDIYYEGKLATPIVLKNGYLLDNRGINKNTVFLDYTYEDYSKLSAAPSMEEMMDKIMEKHPITKLIDCGARVRNEGFIDELNKLIDDDFPNCTKIKITALQVTL